MNEMNMSKDFIEKLKHVFKSKKKQVSWIF